MGRAPYGNHKEGVGRVLREALSTHLPRWRSSIYGTDEGLFYAALRSEVPDLGVRLQPEDPPPTLAILDALQFCYRVVQEAHSVGFHDYYRHYHLRFESGTGREAFRAEVNRILSRQGLEFQLGSDGAISRLEPEPLSEILHRTTFETGDEELDIILNTAVVKYLSPDPEVRREALEKLWDAWERLKTIEPGDKKASTGILLDRTSGRSSKEVREMLEGEAQQITNIGNEFRIRHHESDKIPIRSDAAVDYFFHRCFALIRLVLVRTKRTG